MNTLPTPKPARKRRWPLRLAAFALAGSALFAAYWFTRPPELVWWRSPAIGSPGRHIRVLAPPEWEMVPIANITPKPTMLAAAYRLSPADRAPIFLRWLLPKPNLERACIVIMVRQSPRPMAEWRSNGHSIDRWDGDAGVRHSATELTVSGDRQVLATINYERANLSTFNRTYKQICDSLTIE